MLNNKEMYEKKMTKIRAPEQKRFRSNQTMTATKNSIGSLDAEGDELLSPISLNLKRTFICSITNNSSRHKTVNRT